MASHAINGQRYGLGSAIEPVVLWHLLFHDGYGGLDQAITCRITILIHPHSS